MILERSLHPDWTSNTYLLGDAEEGTGVFIDAGGPMDALVEAVERHNLRPTHVLLTHHHHDHVAALDALCRHYPGMAILTQPLEAERIDGVTGEVCDGDVLELGGLRVSAIATPGHTAGMLSFVVDDAELFTGDTLFRGSVGGVRAPGSTGYGDLRSSVMGRLMVLPHELRVRPGHADPTTVGEEWESNPFVRIWRGVDPEGDEPCTALGQPARLVLLARDYDGGHKAWVRWADGSDDIVPGSQVERTG